MNKTVLLGHNAGDQSNGGVNRSQRASWKGWLIALEIPLAPSDKNCTHPLSLLVHLLLITPMPALTPRNYSGHCRREWNLDCNISLLSSVKLWRERDWSPPRSPLSNSCGACGAGQGRAD